MSVEKTVTWENEKWALAQYFDGVWTLKSKGDFVFEHPSEHQSGIDISLDYEEISTLKEIIKEVVL